MGGTTGQVGGDHYRCMKIQPIDFIVANNIPYREANVIKYIVRWRHSLSSHDSHYRSLASQRSSAH